MQSSTCLAVKGSGELPEAWESLLPGGRQVFLAGEGAEKIISKKALFG